jgi:hypothetical protein
MKMFFLMLAVLTATARGAMADSKVQKREFNGVSSFFAPLAFDRFNINGTLTSVEITLNLQIAGGTFILDNDSNDSVSGISKFGSYGSVTSTDLNLPNPFLTNQVFCSQPFSLGSNVGDGIGDYDPSEPDGGQYNGGNEKGTISDSVNSMFWNDYIGTGTYNITASIASLLDYGGFDGLECSISSPVSTSGYVEVTYEYNVIPEPATIATLSFGLLWMGRRRRKKTES